MYGYQQSRSVIAALVAGLCAALFSVSSLAITIDVGRSPSGTWGVDGFNHTSSGINGRQGQTFRMPPLNTNLNVTRNAVVPYNSLANGMRNFVRINPASVAASAAVTGLFLAVDWVWDELASSWGKIELICPPGVICDQFGDVNVPGYCSGGVGGYSLVLGNQLFTTDRVTPIGSVNYPAGTVINVSLQRYDDSPYPSGEGVSLCQKNQFPELANTPNRVRAYKTLTPIESPVYGDYEESFIDLSPSDWSELEGYLPSANPDQVGTAGQDTQRLIGGPLPGYSDQTITGPSSISGDTTTSTTTDPSTGQSTITEISTTTNISYGDTTITTTTTTTTTNYNSDGSVSSETVTETTPGQEVISGTASSWPGFCEWAVVVCNWLDWTKEGWPEEEPELPQVVDFTPDGDFQVGGPGSCPAPYVLSIGWLINQAFEVSYQPFCDLALIVNPLFLAFCYLLAGVLTVRSL